MAVQVALADQVAGEERRSGRLVAREDRARESFLGFEHRTAVDEHRRALRHSRHDRMTGIRDDLDNRAAQKKFFRLQPRDHVPNRELQPLDREGARIARAHDRAAAADELLEPLQIVGRELIRVLGADRASAATRLF